MHCIVVKKKLHKTHKSTRPISYEGAPIGMGRWLLWKHGGVRRNSFNRSSIEVECYFLELNQEDNLAPNANIHCGWIDMSAFPKLNAGSVFQNGLHIGIWHGLETYEITLECANQEPFIVGSDRDKKLQKTITYVRKGDIEEGEIVDTTQHTRIAIKDTSGYHTKFHSLLMPNSEIARFFIGGSSKLAYEVFHEPSCFDNKSKLYSVSNTKFIKDKVFKIAPSAYYTRGGSIQDLAVILAHDDIKRVWQQLSASGIATKVKSDLMGNHSSSVLFKCEWPELTKKVKIKGIPVKSYNFNTNIQQQSDPEYYSFDILVFYIEEDYRPMSFGEIRIAKQRKSHSPNSNDAPTRKTYSSRFAKTSVERRTLVKGAKTSTMVSPELETYNDLENKYPNLGASIITYQDVEDTTEIIEDVIDEHKELHTFGGPNSSGKGNSRSLDIAPKARSSVSKSIRDTEQYKHIQKRRLFQDIDASITPKFFNYNVYGVDPLESVALAVRYLSGEPYDKAWLGPDDYLMPGLMMDPDWGNIASLRNGQIPRKAIVMPLFIDNRAFYLFDLEKKLNARSRLGIVTKTSGDKMDYREQAIVLKSWVDARLSKDQNIRASVKTTKSLWPNHSLYLDVLGWDLKHSSLRRTNPKAFGDTILNVLNDLVL